MKPLAQFPVDARRAIRGVLTDIDDTLTTSGRLLACAYEALENLRDAGFIVMAVTGRPAGWCDHIARLWPVDAVVGENGAFWFRYDAKQGKLVKRYVIDAAQRALRASRMQAIAARVLREVPGCAIASDQPYREADLAIDFREDVAPLPREDVARIVAILELEGMTAKVSSIHVNAWFGGYDKLSTTKACLAQDFATDLESEKERWVFAGDSPNDQPMFAYFPNAVGVANVHEMADLIEKKGGEVKYAIHPVAGRMPGHMNVLLAEANVPYDRLFEMDEINPEMPLTDVAVVVGANDVVNPAARSDSTSPIYGMPIIDADKATNVVVIKRSLSPGFAGIDNPLFYNEKTSMLYADAKAALEQLLAAVKSL